MKHLLTYSFTTCTLLAFLYSCIALEQPISSAPSQNNQTYKVEYLFEHEGCKVYRFRDHGGYVYFTNCSGSVTAIRNDSIRTQVQTIEHNVNK